MKTPLSAIKSEKCNSKPCYIIELTFSPSQKKNSNKNYQLRKKTNGS